jgi:2'-5' RNA ligase
MPKSKLMGILLKQPSNTLPEPPSESMQVAKAKSVKLPLVGVLKSFPGHQDVPGKRGGSAPRNLELKPPNMPQELQRAAQQGIVQQRLAERAKIMEDTYGVKFSPGGSNPLGVAEAKKLGIPGVGLPRAIYEKSDPISDPAKISLVEEAFKKYAGKSGYLTFTTIKFATGLPFKEVFGVFSYLYNQDPYSVTWSVDRIGKNVSGKLIKPKVIKKQLIGVLKQHIGAMVAFDMSDDDFAKDIEDPHITLVYLGDIANLDQEAIKAAIQDFAYQHAPISGTFAGTAVFPISEENDNKAPVVALFDSAALPAFRQALLHKIAEVVPSVLEQTHGFTAHMTLNYTNAEIVPVTTSKADYAKTFNKITLYWGDDKTDYTLTGTVIEKHLVGILKSFPGHAGRPGQQGGSLPRGEEVVAEQPKPAFTEADNPYQEGFFDQKPNETDEEYNARLTRSRAYRANKRVDEESQFAIEANTELNRLKREDPQHLINLGAKLARKMNGTWDWQGMVPEQQAMTGLKKYIQKYIRTNLDNRYTVSETPLGDGTSRYMLGFAKAKGILKSFPDHLGIPGHQGGSLPRDDEAWAKGTLAARALGGQVPQQAINQATKILDRISANPKQEATITYDEIDLLKNANHVVFVHKKSGIVTVDGFKKFKLVKPKGIIKP